MKYPVILVVLVGSLFVVGCSNVQTEHTILEGATYTEYSPDRKVVVLSNPPDKPFVRIANLRATAEEPTSQEELTQGLIDEARKLGADAIIDVELEEQDWNYSMPIIGPGGGVAGGVQNKGRIAVLTGVAIKYK